MKLRNSVVGIGSPHGDDQVGLRLVERLRSCPRFRDAAIALHDPLQLLDSIDNCDRLVIVDACRSGGDPGTVTRLQWPDVQIEDVRSRSTHGMGVAAALELAEQLGRVPAIVVLFVVELADCSPGHSLSDAVESALDELEEKILLELRR